jgi:hypothetical protein
MEGWQSGILLRRRDHEERGKEGTKHGLTVRTGAADKPKTCYCMLSARNSEQTAPFNSS